MKTLATVSHWGNGSKNPKRELEAEFQMFEDFLQCFVKILIYGLFSIKLLLGRRSHFSTMKGYLNRLLFEYFLLTKRQRAFYLVRGKTLTSNMQLCVNVNVICNYVLFYSQISFCYKEVFFFAQLFCLVVVWSRN